MAPSFERPKFALIVNAGAGTLAKRPDLGQEALAQAFADEGIDVEIEYAEPDALTRISKRAFDRAGRKEFDAIVVGGGDGTVQCVAALLAGSDIPLGVLPLGTLNHFAKDLGIPTDLPDAIRALAARNVTRVDLGEVNGRIFVNNSSIGIYPFMVLDRDRRQELHGMAKWTAMGLALVRAIRKFPIRRVSVTTEEDAQHHRTPCLFVGNNQYGIDALNLGKRQQLDAGALWLCIVQPRNPTRFIWLVGRMVLGFPKLNRDLVILKSPTAEIEAGVSRLPVALDGEVEILETPLRYRIRPKTLAVLVPGDAPEAPANG
jgi:diacylglycerol kinase family enzyme